MVPVSVIYFEQRIIDAYYYLNLKWGCVFMYLKTQKKL